MTEQTTTAREAWHTPRGGLIEAQQIARQAYKAVEAEKAINGHIPGHPYDVTLAALNPVLAALDTLLLTTLTTPKADDIAEGLRALLAKATKGPWEVDTERNEDGAYGSGPDFGTGYDDYLIGAAGPDGKWLTLFGSENSTAKSIAEDYDEDYHAAWDETAKLNAALIVAAVNALPQLLADRATASGEKLQDRIARAYYESSPAGDQPTDVDGRATGPGYEISWEQLGEYDPTIREAAYAWADKAIALASLPASQPVADVDGDAVAMGRVVLEGRGDGTYSEAEKAISALIGQVATLIARVGELEGAAVKAGLALSGYIGEGIAIDGIDEMEAYWGVIDAMGVDHTCEDPDAALRAALASDPAAKASDGVSEEMSESAFNRRRSAAEKSSCPKCGSPAPHKHPEGDYEDHFIVCADPYHLTTTDENRAEDIARVVEERLGMGLPAKASDGEVG